MPMTLPASSLRRWLLPALIAPLLMLAGCGAMQAQNPSSPLKPVRAVAIGDDAHVLLDGHDVVAYFTLGRHALGSPQFKTLYQGVTFYFASAEHKALFDQAPSKYLPQFGGFCANGISFAIPWGGDAGSRAAFELDRAGNLALAEKYWREEVAGSNSFVQRSKRLVFRVPHYKSGAELERMVQEAAARKP
jgi:YHS domain-containing protein